MLHTHSSFTGLWSKRNLAYYVREYQYSLPMEFVDRVLRRAFEDWQFVGSGFRFENVRSVFCL